VSNPWVVLACIAASLSGLVAFVGLIVLVHGAVDDDDEEAGIGASLLTLGAAAAAACLSLAALLTVLDLADRINSLNLN
jgi:hypothetical protein